MKELTDDEEPGFWLKVTKDFNEKELPKILAKTMELTGFIVYAKDGWVVREYKDGKIELIKQIENYGTLPQYPLHLL